MPNELEKRTKALMQWASWSYRVYIVSLRKWQTNMENFLAGNSLAGFRLPLPQHVGTWRRRWPTETGSIQT